MTKNKYSKVIAGTMTWGQWGKQLDKKNIARLMHHCIDNQITTFDHADIYGDYTTEAEFGNAFAESNIDRNNIQLISKCGIQLIGNSRKKNKVKHYNYSKKYIIQSAEQSLKNLKTEYLDILLLHRPSPLMQLDDIVEAVSTLKQQGKIKDFGVSNFTPSQTDLLSKHLDISVNQIQFSLTEHTAMHNGSLDHMQLNNIQPMSWSPLGSLFRKDNEKTRRIHKQLGLLLAKYNVTEDQLALAWILKHPANILPVVGTTNTKRLTDAITATTIELELEEWFLILEASQGHEAP